MTTTVTDRAALVTDVAIKAPCRAATTANITLSGTQTIDGVAVVADDRVLVKNQTDQTTNGIYVVSATAWTRAPDFDGTRDAVSGTMVLVTAGTVAAGVLYELTTANPITIGSSNITFTAILASTAGANLTALAALDSTAGIMTQTAVATFTKRTLTGTANQVIIADGDGVAGNPTFTLPQSIGAASNVTFNQITLQTGGKMRTASSAGNTIRLVAYDVDGGADTTFITLTANDIPTCDLSDSVTKASGYIYRAGGTDVPVTDGGTGASTAANARINLGLTDSTADLALDDVTVDTLTAGVVTDAGSTSYSGIESLVVGPFTLTDTATISSLSGITVRRPILSNNTGATNTYGIEVEAAAVSGNASISNPYGLYVRANTITDASATLSGNISVNVETVTASNSASLSAPVGIQVKMPTAQTSSSISGTSSGVNITAPTTSGGATIATAAGLNIANMGTTGITTSYGILIAAQSNSATPYAINYNSNSFYVDANGFMKDAGRSRVATQFDKTTNTTLANVTGLTATVLANGIYAFRAHLTTTAGASGGMKVAIAGTATATTISYTGYNFNGTTLNAVTTSTALAGEVAAATAVTTNVIIEGTIVVSTAGTLTVQMAQNASDAATSSVLVNSKFVVERIS